MESLLRDVKHYRVVAEHLRDDPSGRFKVVEDLDTGLTLLRPLPTVEDDAAFYSQDVQRRSVFGDAGFTAVEKHLDPDKRRQLALLRGLRSPPARFLDVGCGYGQMVLMAREAGYDATGVEVQGQTLNCARKRGLRVIEGDFSTNVPASSEEPYDLVLMSHVMEHLRQPERFLANVARVLKPDGLLVIEVPNLADHMIQRCSPYAAYFWQRGHVAYYTPETLRRVLERAGLKVIAVNGRQRYSVASVTRWLETGKPGLHGSDPYYEAPSNLQWLDEVYRPDVEQRRVSDALFAIAKVGGI